MPYTASAMLSFSSSDVDAGKDERATLGVEHRPNVGYITLSDQSSRKLTSTFALTATAFPSFMLGRKRHFRTASIAFSSSPRPRGRVTRMFVVVPSGRITMERITAPWNLALRASSEYSGSGLK